MSKTVKDRKARFRAALALAGMTAGEWADKNDVTPGHLSQVLAGRHESARLTQKIESFTERYLTATMATV